MFSRSHPAFTIPSLLWTNLVHQYIRKKHRYSIPSIPFSSSSSKMKLHSAISWPIGGGLWWLTTRRTAAAFGASSSASPFDTSSWLHRTFGTRRTSSLAAAKKEIPFTTWSFDKACPTMEWSPLSHVSLVVAPDSTADPFPTETFSEADLIVIGIMAPAKEEEDDDEDDAAEKKNETAVALTGVAAAIDAEWNGVLTEVLTESMASFKNGAKLGSVTPMVRCVVPGKSTRRTVLLGLGAAPKEEGSAADCNGLTLGKALAQLLASLKKVTTVHVLLPAAMATNATILRDLSTGMYQDLHVDNRYRTGDKKKKVAEDVQTVTLFGEGTAAAAIDAGAAIDLGRQVAGGVILTKDIVNAPHNVLNSESLAETAKRIAKEAPGGRIKCTILGKKECEARGMGAYLGVARGSETEPQFIHLTYTPGAGPIHKKVAVIGKGLLFDTGGYNIKTQMMEMMKFDCGGAAAVLGAARAIGVLQPPGVEIHFLVAACENMINDKAMVPSDILTASNGKTIEVLNTDAEGRLTLADALVYADKELQCESIIELSTLTGACMVALGKSISGVWTDNEALARELAEISQATGDKSWRMPLEKEYNEALESKFADLKNIGGKYGGSITAALFLQNFVSKKKPFAHIDIAGPVWSEKSGATGYGTKLIVEWVTRQGRPPKEE
jgi:leucyl aminopeptidase